MSPSLSTTQPYMPFRPAEAKFSLGASPKSIKAIKTGLAKTSAIFWVVFGADGLSSGRGRWTKPQSESFKLGSPKRPLKV